MYIYVYICVCMYVYIYIYIYMAKDGSLNKTLAALSEDSDS